MIYLMPVLGEPLRTCNTDTVGMEISITMK